MLEKLTKRIRQDVETLEKELSNIIQEFMTEEEYGKLMENGDDAPYELPVFGIMGKYDYYDEYRILRIENGEAFGIGSSEGSDGDEYTQSLKNMSTDELFGIAQHLL